MRRRRGAWTRESEVHRGVREGPTRKTTRDTRYVPGYGACTSPRFQVGSRSWPQKKQHPPPHHHPRRPNHRHHHRHHRRHRRLHHPLRLLHPLRRRRRHRRHHHRRQSHHSHHHHHRRRRRRRRRRRHHHRRHSRHSHHHHHHRRRRHRQQCPPTGHSPARRSTHWKSPESGRLALRRTGVQRGRWRVVQRQRDREEVRQKRGRRE